MANLIAVLVNLAFIPLFLWMLKMPFTVLAPIIFVLSCVGGYAAVPTMHSLSLIVIFGLIAFFMRVLDYPLAPLVLALVLGKTAEESFVRSMQKEDGNFWIFLDFAERPIAAPITVIALILLAMPLITLIRRKVFPRRRDEMVSEGEG